MFKWTSRRNEHVDVLLDEYLDKKWPHGGSSQSVA